MATPRKNPRKKRPHLTPHLYFSEGDMILLNRMLDKYRESDKRNIALFDLALATGARASELLLVRGCDLIDETKSVFITAVKDSNDRMIPVSEELFARLKSLVDGENEKIWKFEYPNLRKIWDHYRPVNKKFHAFRHTFAIHLYQRTKDLLLVKKALGHRDIRNTNIYLEFTYSVSELRRLMYGSTDPHHKGA